MSDLRKSVLGLHHKRSMPPTFGNNKPNYTPLKWQDYFENEEYITTPSGQHHIYKKGSKGPIIFCLHGGGYNGLTWSLFTKEIYANIECQVIAVDFRGHGNTKTDNDGDLSLETLTEDIATIANILCERENTSMVLVGHSMGGAIAVNASYKINNLVGLCVIDVVEGTALDALSSMQSILRGRPSYFKTIPHAIQWCYKGGQCHNLEAARVSMPGQIVNVKTGKLGSDEWEDFDKMDGTNLTNLPSSELRASEFTLTEVDEDDGKKETEGQTEGKPPLPQGKKFKVPKTTPDEVDGPQYTWRIDLSKTETYWQHWFQGLSVKFLGTKIPKILILANIHGLDTKLTVGQMQGKFQLQVLAKTGHAVQEDQPHQVAEILSIYLVKQKCAETKAGFTMPLHPNTCC
ncbi:protein phosphatase methylesterase 1 isoform X2 [Rhynchophorus ferrugineus]